MRVGPRGASCVCDRGTRRLAEEITAIQGSHSSGGRRPRGPVSVGHSLAQIVKMSEKWARWHEGFSADENGRWGRFEGLAKIGQ